MSEDENATIEEKDFDLVIQRVASPEFFRGDDPLMQDKINSETEFSTEEQRIVDKQPGTIDTKQILEDAKNEGQTSAIDVSDPKDKKLFISKSFTSEGEKGPGYKSEVKRELRKQVKKGLPEIIK